jgi:undecaprenyl-diphosphatase
VLLNRRRALLLAAGLLGAAVLVGVLVAVGATRHDVQTVDGAARRLAVEIQNRPATVVAEALSFVGGGVVTWTIRAGTALVLAVRRRFPQLVAFALAVATSEALIGTLKSAFDRSRPPGGLVATTGGSFPSGHAIAAAVTAIGLVLTLHAPGRSRRNWEACAVGYVIIMAISRIYLRAHWLSDAVAGTLLGAGLAVGWPAVVDAVRARRGRRAQSCSPAGSSASSR